jgi:hypothetical protein
MFLRDAAVLALLGGPVAFASTPARPSFKCEAYGKVTYSDVACSGGHQLVSTDTREPAVMSADTVAANQRAGAERAQLKDLETSRHRQERVDELQNRRARSVALSQHHKCLGLALRKKWLEEDVISASARSSRKAKKKSHRLAERYALECGA